MGGLEPKKMGHIAKALGASPIYASFKVSFAEFAKTSGVFKMGSNASASYEKAQGVDFLGSKYESNALTVDIPAYKGGTLKGIKASTRLFMQSLPDAG